MANSSAEARTAPNTAKTYRAAVVGGSGYTGAELLRLLAGHPEIGVEMATASSHAGESVADLFPSLRPAYPDLRFTRVDPEALDGLDVVFCGLPHGESQAVVPDIAGRVGHVVDLGADFRLPAAQYARWYGAEHTAPHLLDRFSFGIPELFRKDIVGRPHVASPGCYPTTAGLALAPLFVDGIAEPTSVVVDAASGVSGRGRGLSAPSLYSEAADDVSTYGLLTHRHTGEIEHVLARVANAGAIDHPPGAPVVLFTPHLVPMPRGIHATCHARAVAPGVTTERLLALYRDFYADEPFVTVVDEPPHTKATLGGNSAHVTVRFSERTGTILALGVLDNLVKGASGQAVQNANLLLGLPETLGLSTTGLWP